jgi:hypothetical protein
MPALPSYLSFSTILVAFSSLFCETLFHKTAIYSIFEWLTMQEPTTSGARRTVSGAFANKDVANKKGPVHRAIP